MFRTISLRHSLISIGTILVSLCGIPSNSFAFGIFTMCQQTCNLADGRSWTLELLGPSHCDYQQVPERTREEVSHQLFHDFMNFNEMCDAFREEIQQASFKQAVDVVSDTAREIAVQERFTKICEETERLLASRVIPEATLRVTQHTARGMPSGFESTISPERQTIANIRELAGCPLTTATVPQTTK